MSSIQERQRIGASRPKTDTFLRLRLHYRTRSDDRVRKDLTDIASSYKSAPNSTSNFAGMLHSIVGSSPLSSSPASPSAFPTSRLFSSSRPSTSTSPPSSKPAPNINNNNNKGSIQSGDFCPLCGDRFNLINKKVQCGVCQKSHCTKCLLKLTRHDLPEMQIDSEIFMMCARCKLVREHVTKKQAFKSQVSLSLSLPLPRMWNSIKDHQNAILSIMPKYEYLSMSVIDPEVSSASNAATFYKVYEDVLQMQQEMNTLFQKYELDIKALSSIPNSSKTADIIKRNIIIITSEFLQNNLPKFRSIQKKILQIESSTATNMYFVLARAAIDNKSNTNFWSKFGKYYVEILQISKTDMQKAVIAAGDNWDAHKKSAEDLIISYEPTNNKKSSSILNLLKAPDLEFEGTLIRKNISVLRGALNQMENKIGSNSLGFTKTAVVNLIDILSRSYSHNLSLE